MDNEIKGIKCEVKNCKYHDQSDNCHAGTIKVGNQSATSVSDTSCETFVCGDHCDCK